MLLKGLFKQNQPTMSLLILTLALLLTLTLQLSAIEARDRCHCNLNINFCDIDCCCDTDCSSVIADSCFRTKSIKFCVQKAYYYAINTNYYSQNSCYFYNSTNSLQQEVALSSPLISGLIKKNSPIEPVTTQSSTLYRGYQRTSDFTIEGKSNFQVVDSTGNCLTTLSAATASKKQILKFGRGLQISCQCPNCAADSTLLFTQFINKTIQTYYQDQSNTIRTLESISSDTVSLLIRILVGQYGSQKLKYIQRVISTTETGNSSITTRKLTIQFEQISNPTTLQTVNSAFFPQIPYDMFYPIFMS